jgi:hypothetical protein
MIVIKENLHTTLVDFKTQLPTMLSTMAELLYYLNQVARELF